MTADPPRETLSLPDRLRHRAVHLEKILSGDPPLPLDPVSPGLLREAAGVLDQWPVTAYPRPDVAWPLPPGYSPWVSMGNSGIGLGGQRVADTVLDAWVHYANRLEAKLVQARPLGQAEEGPTLPERMYSAALDLRFYGGSHEVPLATASGELLSAAADRIIELERALRAVR